MQSEKSDEFDALIGLTGEAEQAASAPETRPSACRNKDREELTMDSPAYGFLREAGRIINAGQSRSIALTGNIYDLFCLAGDSRGAYVPLIDFLIGHWSIPSHILLVYEVNGPIRFVREGDQARLRDAWLQWHGESADDLAIQRMLDRSPRWRRANGTSMSAQRAISQPSSRWNFFASFASARAAFEQPAAAPAEPHCAY